MAELEPFRECSDRRRLLVLLQPLDLQEHQVVLRLDPGRPGGNFARAEKPANLVSERGEGSIVDGPLELDPRCLHGQRLSI